MAIAASQISIAEGNVGVDYQSITAGTAAITPGPFRALWVGTQGNITIVSPYGTTQAFVAVAGLIPVAGTHLLTATASDIVAIY